LPPQQPPVEADWSEEQQPEPSLLQQQEPQRPEPQTRETAEALATGPGEEDGGNNHANDGRILDAAEEELMNTGDINGDGAGDDQPPVTHTRNDEQEAADNLKDLDELKITGAFHRVDEVSSRSAGRGRRNRLPLEEEVQASEDEEET